MTWEWLKTQVIHHYGSPSGALAMAAEWEALRMGVKNIDGSESGGKSTWTVMAYTALFLHYMRALTAHSVQTTDVLVIIKYVGGIKSGYDALYKVMLGVQKVLWFDTLKEAIEAAEIAEVTLTVSRIDRRGERSANKSTPSSGSSGTQYGRYNRGGKRQSGEALNNVEGTGEEEGKVSAPATPSESESAKVFGFRYHGPGPNDGRFPLTEPQAKLLYDARGCFRCHMIHPLPPNAPRCAHPPAKTAPKLPLKNV